MDCSGISEIAHSKAGPAPGAGPGPRTRFRRVATAEPDTRDAEHERDPRRGQIIIRGARTHNLKNVDLTLPRAIAGRDDWRQRLRQSRRSPSTRSTRKGSVGTSSRCPRTPDSFSSGWKSRTSIRSKASVRRSRFDRRTASAIRARRSARRPRFTTICACCTRGSDARTAAIAAARSFARPPKWSRAVSASCLREHDC